MRCNWLLESWYQTHGKLVELTYRNLLAKLGLLRGCQLNFLSHSRYFFPFISDPRCMANIGCPVEMKLVSYRWYYGGTGNKQR